MSFLLNSTFGLFASGGGGTLVGAADGVSLEGLNVALFGSVGNPSEGKFTSQRMLQLNGFDFIVGLSDNSDTGNISFHPGVLFTVNALGTKILADGINELIRMGDPDLVGNGAYMQIDNPNQNIGFYTGGTISQIPLLTIDTLAGDIVFGGATATPLSWVNATGFLGVGTLTPAEMLDVSGTAHILGNTTLTSLAGSGDRLVVADSTGLLKIGGSTGVQLSLTANPSAAGILSLSATKSYYTFTGTTGTWSLPVVVGNSGVFYFIKNRGSGVLTINVTGGTSDIYAASAIASQILNPGDAFIFSNDGFFWNVQ